MTAATNDSMIPFGAPHNKNRRELLNSVRTITTTDPLEEPLERTDPLEAGFSHIVRDIVPSRQPDRSGDEISHSTREASKEAKQYLTKASTVVKQALIELREQIDSIITVLEDHEKTVHHEIDSHFYVCAEASKAYIETRDKIESWKSKIGILQQDKS
jgi:hypothetical protein